MKISKKILSAVTAAAVVLTLTACNGDTTPQNPLDIIISGITSSSAISSGSSGTSSENTSSSTSTTSEPQIDVDFIPEAPASDFEYEYKDRLGGIEITKYVGDKEVVRIPAKINGESVTSIGEDAFVGCVGLTSVTIPDSVTEIGLYAFSDCTGLTSVTIPNSVTEISSSAFEGCTGLTSVTIPNSVTEIGDFAFQGCTGLTSVTIPDSVTKIGGFAFSDCTGLTSVTIPDSVTHIDLDAFQGCTGLTTINVDSNNQNYSSKDGALYNKDMTKLIKCPAKIQGSFTIPNSVTYISGDAFDGCTGLTRINVDSNNQNYTSKDGVLYNKNMTTLIQCPGGIQGSLSIPNSVTYIGNGAFWGCTGLTSVTIPNSVTEISISAFGGCTGLTSVTIPNSVTEISSSAFGGCTGLTSITIPNSVKKIGMFAFSGCTGLKNVIIPNSVTEIGEYAFSRCTAEITYKGKIYTPENYSELY